jgi:hypothetical protein
LRPGERFPGDQAEVSFTEESIDWLIENVTATEREAVFDTICMLFSSPDGKHRLSNQTRTNLVGFNTVEACQRTYRIIYRANVRDGVGLIEVVTIGLRRDNDVYSMAGDLIRSGKLTESEQTQIWDALRFLGETKERFGLEEWDYLEDDAPIGLVKSAVAAGVLDEDFARRLSKSELNAAMAGAFSTGVLDTEAAIQAAMERIATSATPDRVFTSRQADRCGLCMPVARAACIRVSGHPGAHRARR